MRFLKKKRYAIPAVVAAGVLAVAGSAFAYFSTTGGGTGSAAVATNASLVINQTGVTLYNSTIGLNNYFQDQCFGCASISEFGNTVNLGTSVLSNDLNVVVALRNWGPAIAALPVTLTLYNPGADAAGSAPGSLGVSDTQDFAIPAMNTTTGAPGLVNITFDSFTPWMSIPSTVAYGISYDGVTAAPSLNVALSSSSSDISVGSDPYNGTVLIDAGAGSGFPSDAGTCTDETPGVFSLTNVWCNDTPAGNYGAYGSAAGADIPAVEFIDTASGLAGLYPGGSPVTVGFTVYNPGLTTEALNSVTITVASDTNGYVESTPGDTLTDVVGCYASWFTTTPQTWSGGSIASGGTVSGSGTVLMPASTSDQDACQGATLGLVFAAS
jgi:hypothetical protein